MQCVHFNFYCNKLCAEHWSLYDRLPLRIPSNDLFIYIMNPILNLLVHLLWSWLLSKIMCSSTSLHLDDEELVGMASTVPS